jgi:hypothetical protein
MFADLETGAPSQSHVLRAPGRTRTYDRQIRRLLLYPLSYGGLGMRHPLAVRTGSHHCSAEIAGMNRSSV